VTARDRTVLIVVAGLAALAAVWFLALAPKRHEASDLSAQIVVAQTRLDTANAAVAQASAARDKYASDYTTVARLGKAVPVSDDVPSLLYQLESTAHQHGIDFRTMDLVASGSTPSTPQTNVQAAVASANGTTPAAATSAAVSVLPPGASVGAAGFPTMPFTFGFNGKFFDMQRFVRSLDGLTAVTSKDGQISVKGRLLTIDAFALKAAPQGFPRISATINATAYLLPAAEGLTGGASAASPSTSAATTSSLVGATK
jgi:type II secretory pathway pseudopilin PulG